MKYSQFSSLNFKTRRDTPFRAGNRFEEPPPFRVGEYVRSKIIIAGSEGLIGKQIQKMWDSKDKVVCADLSLGHDFSDETCVKRFFKENQGDYLINLFALNDHVKSGEERQTFMDISLDSFKKYLDVNLTALFSCCREFIRNNKSGGIVNFASLYGVVSPNPKLYDNGEKHIAYGVSKAGVIQLTKHLAVHAAPNFRVNCVVPGGISADQSPSFVDKYSRSTPMGRMMDVGEIYGIVKYLCSDESKYMTGSVITIDGGYTAI